MDKVSIIVTTYLEKSRPYLDACIASIKNLNYPPHLLDVVIVGRLGYMPVYGGVRTVAPFKETFGCAEGINYGIEQSDPTSRYIFTINDDVILTQDCVINLVNAIGEHDMILNPISNCDNGIKYSLLFSFYRDGQEFQANGRQYVYEDLKPYLTELMNARSNYPAGVILQNELFFYATMIPRKVWDKVGKFDEVFLTGQDDIDYSLRARQKGVHLGCCMSAVAWHFSGASADHTMTDPIRARNMQYFKYKWGFYPFHQELNLPPFDIRELDFIGE